MLTLALRRLRATPLPRHANTQAHSTLSLLQGLALCLGVDSCTADVSFTRVDGVPARIRLSCFNFLNVSIHVIIFNVIENNSNIHHNSLFTYSPYSRYIHHMVIKHCGKIHIVFPPHLIKLQYFGNTE